MTASEFRVGSDSRQKTDIEDFGFSALETIVNNPSKKWKRTGGDTALLHEDDHKPQRAVMKRNGTVKTTADGDTVFEEVQPVVQQPWFFGPMADRLPPDLVYTDSDSGMKKIGLVSMIGVLWKAIEELSTELKELRDARQ